MPDSPSPNAKLTAVVRPEMLALCPPDTPESWRGHITMRRYAGAHFIYNVMVDFAPGLEQYHDFEVNSESGEFAERSQVAIKLLPKPIALFFQ
jgi:hypothetical protein